MKHTSGDPFNQPSTSAIWNPSDPNGTWRRSQNAPPQRLRRQWRNARGPSTDFDQRIHCHWAIHVDFLPIFATSMKLEANACCRAQLRHVIVQDLACLRSLSRSVPQSRWWNIFCILPWAFKKAGWFAGYTSMVSSDLHLDKWPAQGERVHHSWRWICNEMFYSQWCCPSKALLIFWTFSFWHKRSSRCLPFRFLYEVVGWL